MDVVREFLAAPGVARIGVALGYVVVVLVARSILVRIILRSHLSNETKLRWRAQLRNAVVVAVLLGVTLVTPRCTWS